MAHHHDIIIILYMNMSTAISDYMLLYDSVFLTHHLNHRQQGGTNNRISLMLCMKSFKSSETIISPKIPAAAAVVLPALNLLQQLVIRLFVKVGWSLNSRYVIIIDLYWYDYNYTNKYHYYYYTQYIMILYIMQIIIIMYYNHILQ